AVLVSAGLLLRSLSELRSVDPGFRVENVLSGRIIFPSARYEETSEVGAHLERLEERLEAVPGVRAAGATSVLPLAGLVHDVSFGIEGRLPEPGEVPAADERHVTPGFFSAMQVPLLRGRVFDRTDREGAPPVAVVSESFAERYFSGEDPVGRRIRIGAVRDPESLWWTIVGVVGSVRSRALDRDPEPEIYVPMAQWALRGVSLVIRAERDAAGLAVPLREAVLSLDPDMPVAQLATLEDLFAASLAPDRFLSTLLGLFAVLALVLGAVGIYGVMVFMVSRRTREIGVRMALGARPADVLRAVMTRGVWLVLGGLALGTLGAVAASRALSSLLFEVSPTDPVTLIAVAAVLAAAALFACWWPARRATRVDPAVTLRAE
ncbi:MAG: FtsX-like permease family protein, partial [Gemmatimonadota bacterium]